MQSFAPPLCPADETDARLRARGLAVLSREALEHLTETPLPLEHWAPFWNALPPDTYLRDGGHYRRRRHGCFVVEGARVTPVPHRAHWQPVAYNALHGGIERHFEALPAALCETPAWCAVLVTLGRRATALRGSQPFFVEAHLFRIDTTDGIGRPTPEGAHRDGVDLVAVTLIARHAVRGGETRVFDAEGPDGVRFTMQEPGTTLLLDDTRMIHETTPIQPVEGIGWRDTLVITLRSGGFQGP
jgi:hypothetical protein